MPSAMAFLHLCPCDSRPPRAQLITKQRLGHLHNEFTEMVLKCNPMHIFCHHILITIVYSKVQSTIIPSIWIPQNIWIGFVLKENFRNV